MFTVPLSRIVPVEKRNDRGGIPRRMTSRLTNCFFDKNIRRRAVFIFIVWMHEIRCISIRRTWNFFNYHIFNYLYTLLRSFSNCIKDFISQRYIKFILVVYAIFLHVASLQSLLHITLHATCDSICIFTLQRTREINSRLSWTNYVDETRVASTFHHG